MKVVTATEAKNRLGEALSLADDESVLIEKNGKESVMAFSASMGRRIVLSSYAHGGISRHTALKLVGLEWYGDLLRALSEAGITRPCLPQEERAAMVTKAVDLLRRP